MKKKHIKEFELCFLKPQLLGLKIPLVVAYKKHKVKVIAKIIKMER
jgi:hypothetical protein